MTRHAKKIPQRKCVGCQEMKDKSKIIRIVSNENGVSIDVTGKANGRGTYVCKNPGCLEKAKKSKGIERSLKRAIPKETYEQLTTEICKDF